MKGKESIGVCECVCNERVVCGRCERWCESLRLVISGTDGVDVKVKREFGRKPEK